MVGCGSGSWQLAYNNKGCIFVGSPWVQALAGARAPVGAYTKKKEIIRLDFGWCNTHAVVCYNTIGVVCDGSTAHSQNGWQTTACIICPMKFPCAICFKSIPNQPWGVTECGHVFHEGCCRQALAVAVPFPNSPQDNNRPRIPGTGPCPKCRVTTRFRRVYCQEVKDLLDEVTRLRTLQLMQKLSGINLDEQDNTISASFDRLSKPILGRIFHFLVGGGTDVNMLNNLELTRSSFHAAIVELTENEDYQYRTSLRDRVLIPRAIQKIRFWQGYSERNIFLDFLGGAMGIRNIVQSCLEKMNPKVFLECSISLRGDTIEYLTQIVQANIVARLRKASIMAMHRSKPEHLHPYPEVSQSDLKVVDTMSDTDMGLPAPLYLWVSKVPGKGRNEWFLPRFLLNEDLLNKHFTTDAGIRTAHALAHQAGIVKLNRDLSTSIIAEFLHCMTFIVIDAFESSDKTPITSFEERYLPKTEGEDCFENGTNYFTNSVRHINVMGKDKLSVP